MKREKVLDVCPYYYHGSRRYGEQHLVSVPGGEKATTKRETRLHTQTPPSSDLEHLEILHTHKTRNMKDYMRENPREWQLRHIVKERHTQTSFLMIKNKISFLLLFSFLKIRQVATATLLFLKDETDRLQSKSNAATLSAHFLIGFFVTQRMMKRPPSPPPIFINPHTCPVETKEYRRTRQTPLTNKHKMGWWKELHALHYQMNWQ